MKGYRFYLEYPEGVNHKRHTKKKPGPHSGTILALEVDSRRISCIGNKPVVMYTAVGGVNDFPNSPVCHTDVSIEYLRERTKRIPEEMARKIHPNVFALLD